MVTRHIVLLGLALAGLVVGALSYLAGYAEAAQWAWSGATLVVLDASDAGQREG